MSALEGKMSSALIDQYFKLVASQLISDLQDRSLTAGMGGKLPVIPHD